MLYAQKKVCIKQRNFSKTNDKAADFTRKSAALVRVARFELAASWSQTKRPTSWATPGYSVEVFRKVVKHVVKSYF